MVLNPELEIPNAWELLKSLKNPKGKWKSKTPMQKWCYFYGIGRAAHRTIRVSILNDVHRLHWFGYFLITYMSTIMLLSLYSLAYYTYHGEPQMALPSTCMATLFIGHLPITILLTSKKRFKLQSLIDFGGHQIYRDSHKKTKYNRICSDHMDRTMSQFIRKMETIAVSFALSAIAPMYAYLNDGIRSTITETRIPFTEPKSNAEFMGNFLLHSICGSHGALAYTGLEIFLSLLENFVTIAPRLIKIELVQTIQSYKDGSLSKLDLNLKIGNIVKQSNDTDNYVDSLSKLFYWRNFCTPTTFTYLIGMAIFCQYKMNFASGYGLAFMSWTQLFFVCELGEKIQENGFADMLYQTKWEVLPVDIQKVIVLIIHRKQNERGLSFGPLGGGINREIFKLSTNKIYTFVMFLKKFNH